MFWRTFKQLITPPINQDQQLNAHWSQTQWLIFWLLWSILISAIYWILGPHSYMRIQDNTDFNIPYRMAAAQDLLQYGLTYWQPKFSGGMPSLVHPMVDNPLIDGLPYLFFPAWAIYGFVMWLQRFITGYFTFRLCRDILKLNAVGSLFAGLAFSLYLWNVQDMKLVEAFGLPAIALNLWIFDRLLTLPTMRAALWATLMGTTIGMLSQSVIHTVFLLGALPFWFLIVRRVKLTTLLPRYLPFAVSTALLEAPLMITLLTYTPTTTRGQIGAITLTEVPTLAEKLQHTWEIIGWELLPQNGLYWGLFILGVVTAHKIQKGVAWRLLILYLIAGIGSELGHWLQLIWQHYIPPSRGNLLDFNQFTIFLGPLMGGVGLHLLHASGLTASRTNRLLITLITLIALTMPVLNWKKVTQQLSYRMPTDNYAINFDNPILKELAKQQKNSTTPFRVATVGTWPPAIASASGGRIYPTYPHAYGLETVDGYYRLHSARYHHFWQQVIAKMLKAYPEQEERTMKWYYLFLPPENRFADRTPLKFDAWFNLEMLSLANTRFLISHWPINHPALTLYHDPKAELAIGQAWEDLRIRYQIMTTIQGKAPQHALYIYENKSFLPRAFMTNQARIFPDSQAVLTSLATTTALELRQTALLNATDLLNLIPNKPLADNMKFTQSQVTFDQYTPDHLQLTTESNGPGLLVVTNNFDPYWRVKVNGQAGTILPVYHTFQGVLLPEGKNKVTFDYWPPYRF